MVAAQQGHIKEARTLFQQAFDMAKNAGLDGVAATVQTGRIPDKTDREHT
jgi:hypothetical protein